MKGIEDVKNFWERNLCGDEYLKSSYLSNEYFEESIKIRYKYHYHIPKYLNLLSKIKRGGKILEIGLGLGCDTQLLCEKEFEVYGVDLTQKSVEATIARLQHYKLNASIKTGNAEKLDFPDNYFDAVYSFGVLHHTPDTQNSINEVHRVLKKDGIALIMLYNKNSLNYLVHLITSTQYDGSKQDPCPIERAYNKKETQELFSSFTSVKIKADYLFGTGWKWINWFAPSFIKKPLGKIWGWHNMIWAIK